MALTLPMIEDFLDSASMIKWRIENRGLDATRRFNELMDLYMRHYHGKRKLRARFAKEIVFRDMRPAMRTRSIVHSRLQLLRGIPLWVY